MDKVNESRQGLKIMLPIKKGAIKRYTLPGGIKKKKKIEAQALVRGTPEGIKLDLTGNQVCFYLSLINTGGPRDRNNYENFLYTFLEPKKIRVKKTAKPMHSADGLEDGKNLDGQIGQPGQSGLF